jgi:hypothetical protein
LSKSAIGYILSFVWELEVGGSGAEGLVAKASLDQYSPCLIRAMKMEKAREVMMKSFLPAGRKAKRPKETMGRKMASERNSRLEVGTGENSI